MIEAELVYRDEDGNLVADWKQLPFKDFMERWATGKLRRDLDVKVQGTDPTTLSAELWLAFLDLHHQLSLSEKLLAYKEIDSDKPRLSLYPDGEHQYLFPPVYTVAAHGKVQNTVYATLCKLLREITNRDNATVLQLINETSQTNDVYVLNAFTPAVFTTLRNEIWKWALPVTTCVGTANAFSRIDVEEEWFCGFDTACLPQFGGVELLCVGSPHDFIYPMDETFADLFMCSAPQYLGVRCVKEQLALSRTDTGYSVSTTIATAILSAKAVQAATFT